jgi:hypothetical protein
MRKTCYDCKYCYNDYTEGYTHCNNIDNDRLINDGFATCEEDYNDETCEYFQEEDYDNKF